MLSKELEKKFKSKIESEELFDCDEFYEGAQALAELLLEELDRDFAPEKAELEYHKKSDFKVGIDSCKQRLAGYRRIKALLTGGK